MTAGVKVRFNHRRHGSVRTPDPIDRTLSYPGLNPTESSICGSKQLTDPHTESTVNGDIYIYDNMGKSFSTFVYKQK